MVDDDVDVDGLDDWEPEQLTFHEKWWVRQRPFLEDAGYVFRPRYQPGWEASWTAVDGFFRDYEDGQFQPRGMLLDAQRASDGAYVYMKRMSPTQSKGYADELQIHQYLLSEPLKSDPRNRCVPILDVLHVPGDEGEVIMVTPMLRQFYSPRFLTFGEVIAFLAQTFEVISLYPRTSAIEFMHDHRIVHGDCCKENIMMDPTQLYPHSFHPVVRDRRRDWKGNAKHYTRTRYPPKYYLIDFGLSHRYTPEEEPPRRLPVFGGDKSAPEHEAYHTPCDPFPTDVYYLGNLVRKMFMSQSYGFEFMEPLVADMVQTDPTKRPKMDEVVHRYGAIRDALSTRKLRSRIVWRDEWLIQRLFLNFVHLFRTAKYIITRKPAIPMPLS
ncbi:uncharacterized protein STEHIDRAFT_109782 [Stereum hirsutum FP-91666 SS1]|uniref:uncharacterized protein n=1 Tax=Stereum hirsutum (strain FP-91666) TaxID=721885 RepID=UPI000440B74B|nr:uncharacterized protein STEHIDRAFT_109782 [Stereum hirsutum FP-91666 SS1]EIM87924.1 hypothetical protein STEHIDRAFT_109782 [Stereum hirsutum FP-91666 SS1]